MRKNYRQFLWMLNLCLVMSLAISSCSGNLGEPDSAPPAAEEDPEDEETEASAQPLPFTLKRKVRRIMLDTNHRLPGSQDFALVDNSASNLPILINRHSHGGKAAGSISAIHRQSWHLDSNELPDLERFVTNGDAALGATLSTDVRLALVQEPLNLLTYVVANGKPWGHLFSLNKTITSPEIANLWGYQSESVIGSDKNMVLASYTDSRPALGLFATNGLLANFDSESSADLESRTWSMLQTLLCMEMNSASAHQFRDLDDTVVGTDLRDYAYGDAQCSGCHRQYADLANALNGLGNGSSFGTWTYYNNSTPSPSGVYRGQSYTNFEELRALLQNDQRLKSCSIRSLNAHLLQRSFDATKDSETIFTALNLMTEDEDRIHTGYNRILKGPDYLRAPLTNTATSIQTVNSTAGIRVLTLRHWQGVMNQLIPGVELTLKEHLNPGFMDLESIQHFNPTNSYWHAAEAAARKIAFAIVQQELEDQSLQVRRKVLTLLPDGSGQTTDSEVIKNQIIQTWSQMTSYDITAEDRIYLRLLNLYNSIASDDSAATTREAWQAVLTGTMLHEAFITY